MKIGLISDLHTDANPRNKDSITHLINAVKSEKLDVFVIAGDIAPHLTQLAEILNAFDKADIPCDKLFVPGNHDIWAIETPDVTSQQKCDIISQLCYEAGFHPLIHKPFIKENVGFCGTIGWYDYSFAPHGYNFSHEDYAKKELMGAVWNDKRYAKWGDTDKAVTRRFDKALAEHIDTVRQNVSRIIVVTHHVPFRDCIQYPGELPADFFRAFMGSQRIGERCLTESLVTHVLFGHTHRQLDRDVRNVRAICAPIGYLHEPLPIALKDYVEQRLTCFAI